MAPVSPPSAPPPGTAQMTTSRQAYRLGVRLGLARAMGFYYGHIGYYFGQLHFYHTAWIFNAVAFVGALACLAFVLLTPEVRWIHLAKGAGLSAGDEQMDASAKLGNGSVPSAKA